MSFFAVSMTRTGQNESITAATCYVGFFLTGLLYLGIEKNNSFVRFHAMQSTIVFGSAFALLFVCQFYPFGWLIGMLINFSACVMWLVLIWKALQGEKYKVFLFGWLAQQQLAIIEK